MLAVIALFVWLLIKVPIVYFNIPFKLALTLPLAVGSILAVSFLVPKVTLFPSATIVGVIPTP